MQSLRYEADVVIVGGGLAGLVTALELLEKNRRVVLLDRDEPARLGGLARESFGGVFLVDTPHQRRLRIQDSPELAWSDWQRCARFGPEDHWPRRWAQLYCERSIPLIFEFLDRLGVRFLPLVNWPERGLYEPLNSVPRWHIAWGTGYEIATRVIAALEAHPNRHRFALHFRHAVTDFVEEGGRVVGIVGHVEPDGPDFEARGEAVVVASGGICGGDLSKLRAHWYRPWGEPPRKLLNGAHRYADGLLHDRAAALGAHLTHLDLQWHYAAGVHHPARRRPDDGLSLVPPRSALWCNAHGRRIGPPPLVGYTDTRWLVEQVLRQPGQYSWLVLNYKIAVRELAVSGCDYMEAFRYKKRLRMLWELVRGNHRLVRRLIDECPDDFVVADTPEALIDGMNARSLFGLQIDGEGMLRDIQEYDAMIARGPAFFNDEQLRRLMNFRTYRADRLRLCRFQPILDPKARPLIAIRCFILTRKSLGGLKTDLEGRVLRPNDTPIPGLYAVGEAAGFGGGGIHGRGSLEGTFLGGCILTARTTARHL
ncbi:FAD-dependent oxidoreductase [Rhodothermus marinus]|uniref:FAD-dependent oxidoreductase n=1 Tax=Rhodothermus marinus TaxID=29549 RepID=UPI0012BA4339|nr:FAD-dependent oxidoreductase [Rhodothermus marinus]BBM69761.1 KsdD-like steroid dehydrogenase [Rhodothermus marinus]BBM72747.1 KsdD-like steroid dehydrogenase [Rhodothermus marinus]